ncbi:MAG: P-loop NTPase fold protein [Candidatus Eremiobacteraeota bacterium]|nr:P-loop NTPase fold protein [Candidatus Eremiobacteraeota bacterium]
MKMMGLRDLPISSPGEDRLGLKVYAEIFADYIRDCSTPTTIAIQGDWGCGKTSLMRLIKSELESGSQKDSPINTLWFHTWQFSQFSQADNLPFLLIQDLARKIDSRKSNDITNRLLSITGALGKGIALSAASIVGQGEAAKNVIANLEKMSKGTDMAHEIEDLHEKLMELIRAKARTSGRLVIFVDDLDRIRPVRAIELLEVMKLFLESEGCVFVLAIDYEVIRRGLEEKFGIAKAESLESYFDKLIQVPFRVPQDRAGNRLYTHHLLDSLGIKHSDKDVELYVNLLDRSAGFNPRKMKRLLNTILLHLMVGKKLFNRPDIFPMHLNVDSADIARLLFAFQCLALMDYAPLKAFPELFSGTVEEIRERLERLRSFSREDITKPHFDGLREALAKKGVSPGMLNGIVERYGSFLETFYRAIRFTGAPDDQPISAKEIQKLREILDFSAIILEQQGIDNELQDENCREN